MHGEINPNIIQSSKPNPRYKTRSNRPIQNTSPHWASSFQSALLAFFLQTIRPMKRILFTALALSAFASVASAQVTLTDLGQTPAIPGDIVTPTPGADDISQLDNTAQNNDGLNYYFDSGDPLGAVGQTFTTGSNPGGYTLTNLVFKTAGGGGGNSTASQDYHLYIYSVSGTTATLLHTYTGTTSFIEQHWINCSGLSVPMAANTMYAYAFRRDSNGWEQLGNQDGNPYAGGQICRIPTAGGTITFGTAGTVDATFDAGLAPGSVAGGTVVFADLGNPGTPAVITAPTLGPDDISQLLNTSQSDNGLNYYDDNSTPPGQTFTTGPSPVGWVLTNLTIKTAGGGGGNTTQFQGYHLFIYSVSGTTATLLATYTASTTFAENDWLQWSGLSTPLAANTKYAYTFHRDTFGWEHMANQSGNPYAGGDMCIIPQAGGTINYGTSTNVSDAVFVVGLGTPLTPSPGQPSYTPNVSPVYAGSQLTLNEAANGPGPLYYEWLSDGGTGGDLTPVGGFTTGTSLAVDTTAFTPGSSYNYAVIVTNIHGSATSSVVTLTIVAASAPIIITDTTASPATTTNFVGLSETFTAAIEGTLPIAYQWQVSPNADGSGAVNVSGGTNATLLLNNLQLTNTGYYSLRATNSVSPFTINTAWAQLTVVSITNRFITWSDPVPFANLTTTQILNQAGTYLEAAFFGSAAGPFVVTAGTNTYTFTGDGSSASVADHQALNVGAFAYPLTTGDANFDAVLNNYAYNSSVGYHTITLHNLVVGEHYSVQLFAVENNDVGRLASFQDPNNAADVSATYAMGDNKYLIGTFTAPSTDVAIQQNLPFNNGGPALGNMNAVVVRTLTSQTINPDPATLNFNATVTGQTLNLSWSLDHQGWQLYTNAVGLSATDSWFPVPGSASVTSESITIDPSKANVFFQLRLP
jgi:hypothetical protein